jgi:hypothetical protein
MGIMSLLPEPTKLESMAERQLAAIIGRTDDKEHELTGLEWSRVAMHWRCLKAGYYVPGLSRKFERWLRSKHVRVSAEKLFDRFSLEDAIDLLDAKGGAKDGSQTA